MFRYATRTHSSVGYWMLGSGSLVFGIVVFGGLTRLTESGLSITEWNLIRGMKYPSSTEAWEEEFFKYKQTPEYKELNHQMELSQFKSIFFMEWAHRQWGRAIGLTFALPALYFAVRGKMSRPIAKRAGLITGLIGLQGALGWYMVKSGLSEEHLNERPLSTPRVSQYRLAAHLGSAFVIYSLMLSTGLNILSANKSPATLQALKRMLDNQKVIKFRKLSHVGLGAIFVTAISGAFVAGLDAGMIYNEFPKMGQGLIPADFWALSVSSSYNLNPIPWWKNLMENPAAVQFIHRVLAVSTATYVGGLWAYSRFVPLPPMARLAVNCLLGVAGVQVTLGIATLINYVPVPLAAAHQGGSLALLSMAIWLNHALKRVPK